jgi:hypothetical protein
MTYMYKQEFKFRWWREAAADLSWKNYVRIIIEIPFLKGFQAELNFLHPS